ncbi:MAG: hypothetical protein IJ390_00605 [Lachnospiraceae bacterium]|nr:hypothetical protein [Lachnospiraceae bacterium]
MAGYQKKIAYLDYLENGMKIRNAGFVKVEERGTQTRLEMRVKNIPEMFSGEYELKADGGGTVAKIFLNHGSGSCCIVWDSDNTAQNREMRETGGIYIRLPGRQLVQAVWTEPLTLYVEPEKKPQTEAAMPAYRVWEQAMESDLQINSVEVPRKADCAQSGAEEKPEEINFNCQNSAAEEKPEEINLNCQGSPAEETPEEINFNCRDSAAEENICQGGTTQREKDEIVGREPAAEKMRGEGSLLSDNERGNQEPVCYGDKWEQLLHNYPVIHPFEDEREYLSIAPKDFVVLRQEYQKMVHNSFLLHGYYNYRHLILGRISENGKWQYYLGVPGNFYNREKMVAEMFGFEAFEGEREPAKPGDFGYFMKRVDI